MGDMASGRTGGGDVRRRWPRSVGSSVLTPPQGLPVFPDLETAAAERSDIIRSCHTLPQVVVDPCVCGHGKVSHEHYRPGWDCGTCGAVECVDYRPVAGGAVWRMLRQLGLVN